MKKLILHLVLVVFLATSFSRPAWAGIGEYFKNFGKAYARGITNMVTSPLEIPITVQEYHEQSGRPLIRHTAGAVDGTFQTLERFLSGFFDLFVAVIPDYQGGLPPDPETLF